MTKQRHIMASGSGPFFSVPEAKAAVQYLFGLTGKENPKVLMVNTATGDSDYIIAHYMPMLQKHGVQVGVLRFFERTPVDLVSYVNEFDMVWVGGGNTKSMLAVWREWGFDKALRNAYENGVVMAGASAGAICWFEEGLTDSYADEIRVLPCLGWLKGSMCPHYDTETDRRPFYQAEVKAGRSQGGIAADERVFLHYVNEEFHQAVTYTDKHKAYRLDAAEDEIETLIEPKIIK